MGIFDRFIGSKKQEPQAETVTSNDTFNQELYNLKTILGHISSPLFAAEPDGTIFLFPSGASEYLDITYTHAEGRKFFQILPFDPKEKVKEAFFETLESQRPAHAEVKANGKPTKVSLRPMFDDEGHIVGELIELENLAHQKKFEQMQVDFVSFVSHELRTPISTIKGYIDVLREEGDYLKDEHREFLDRIYQSNERQAETVEKLLELSNLESGSINVDLKPIDLSEIIQDEIEKWSDEAKAKGLNLRYIYPKFSLPEVKADKQLLTNILDNLLENAIKYTEDGGVKIEHTQKGDFVYTSVTDSGPGIPKDMQKEIFSKFVRGEHSLTESTQGSGLGLYLTRRFVELMNGKMFLQSEEGKGSMFTFSLEVRQPLHH